MFVNKTILAAAQGAKYRAQVRFNAAGEAYFADRTRPDKQAEFVAAHKALDEAAVRLGNIQREMEIREAKHRAFQPAPAVTIGQVARVVNCQGATA